MKTVEITVLPLEEEFVAYITGPDKLRLDRQDEYKLTSESYIDDSQVTISIQADPGAKKPPSDYATLRQSLNDQGEVVPNSYILHANAKNKLGKVVLVASYNGVEYTKTVEIIPLW